MRTGLPIKEQDNGKSLILIIPIWTLLKFKTKMKELYGQFPGVDRSVGKLIKQLEDLDLSENTIVNIHL